MIIPENLDALWLTVKLAFSTTLILLFIGIPIAWWLAHSKWRFLYIVESLVAMPLILPPTVLGFYLLLFLSPDGWGGKVFAFMGSSSPLFSFTGLLIGSLFYSFPFVVQPLQNTFTSIGKKPLEAGATLGASPFDCFFSIILPLSKNGILTAAVLGFAHTIGEFGVVLMIGGNIPGSTQVISIAIYEHVESLDYNSAHRLSITLLIISFLLLLTVYKNVKPKVW